MPRKPAQDRLPLDGITGRSQGTVERAVAADIRALAELELLPPAVKAIAASCRLVARELDRAEREKDRWGKLAAARELARLRAQLGALTPLPVDDELDDQVAGLAAALRDNPPT